MLGLNVSQLAGALQTTVGGTRASMYRDGGDEYNILVRLIKSDRNRLEFIPQIPINTPLGKTLPIGSLVSMEQTQGPVSASSAKTRKESSRFPAIWPIAIWAA